MECIGKSGAINYIEDQYHYYDKKSISCKKQYYVLVSLHIMTSALIPFIALLIDVWPLARYIVAFMGSIVSILSAFKISFGLHNNWIEYRTTAETLKFHEYLFITASSPYDNDDREKLLINNVNLIVKEENRSWRSAELNNNKNYSNEISLKR